MKKLFALALVVLGLAACQTDPSDLDVNFDGTTTVCLTLPEDAITRAGGSDSAATGLTNTTGEIVRFIMEIYDENGVKSAQRYVDYADEGTLSVTFPVQLVPGRDYTFVAWADMVDAKADVDKYYKTSDLKNITLNGEWNAMEETRDAFTDNCVITDYSGASTIELNLKRPFAKVRVVATDLPQVTNLHLKPTTATVTYTKPIPVSYNAFEQKVGTATESKVHTNFALVGANDEKLYGDNSDAQMVLYADYIFANDEQGAVSFTIETFDQNDQTIKLTTFNTDIAVKRNMLTTIKGDIMTTSNNITVKVENPDEFANGEHEIVVKEANSASELQQIINDAQEGEETVVNIGSDIDLGLGGIILSTRAEDPAYGILVSANKVITLDLCGKTLSMTKECSKSFSMIENMGTLKIVDTKGNDGKISFTDTSAGAGSDWGSYTITNKGTLEVSDVTIEHLGSTSDWGDNRPTDIPIQNYAGKVTVNSGVISSPMFRSLRDFTAGGEIIINGGEFKGQVWMQGLGSGSSSLTINGGEFAPTAGYDGSSIYITNNTNDINVAVNGGFFNTKIGCFDATKEGVKGSIVGGTFTTAAKDNTKVALVADEYGFEENEDGNWDVVKYYVKAGDKYYTTINKALAENTEIELIDNIENAEKIVIAGNTEVKINLNEYNISAIDTTEKNYELIKNQGKLTIEGTGKLTVKATINSGWNRYSAVVANTIGGELTVKGVTLEHLGGTDMAYGIDNLTNGKGTVAITTIDGATVKSPYRAVRQFLNGIEATNELYVKANSVLKGNNKAIFFHDPSTKANSGKLVVEEGAELYGGVYLFVTNGSTEWPVSVSIAASAIKDGEVASANVPANYRVVEVNGIWTIKSVNTIADGVVKGDEDYYEISSKAGMFWFANEVNVNKVSFAGKTVKLAANIDLNNEAWAPVGQTGATTFNGIFDGQNYTISNLNVNSEAQTGAHYSSGLFGWVESHTANHGHIKNVKIAGATIVGHHNCGALVGYITQETALVENCHVTGANVSCTYANGDADGDKAGALIGNATVATPVKNCTAANSAVSAGRDAGQVIGAGKEANVTGCSATEVTVEANGTGTGNNVRNEVIGRLL